MTVVNKSDAGNTTTKRIQPPQLVLPDKAKLVLTEDFQSQFKALCQLEPTKEWSGSLFYELQGGLTDPAGIVCIPRFIYVHDIGSAGYTEYSIGTDILDVYQQFPEYKGKLSIGHIHSHNNMGVFFSGTDMDELVDNADKFNLYLSVIVNNHGAVDVKAAFYADIEEISTTKYVYKDIDGSPLTNTRDVTDKRKALVILNFNMDKHLPPATPTLNFCVERMKVLQEERKKPSTKYLGSAANSYDYGRKESFSETSRSKSNSCPTYFTDTEVVHTANLMMRFILSGEINQHGYIPPRGNSLNDIPALSVITDELAAQMTGMSKSEQKDAIDELSIRITDHWEEMIDFVSVEWLGYDKAPLPYIQIKIAKGVKERFSYMAKNAPVNVKTLYTQLGKVTDLALLTLETDLNQSIAKAASSSFESSSRQEYYD